MADTVIKVENLSKQYRLGQIGTGSIRDDFNRFWARVRGKEDPTLKIGNTNNLTPNSKLQTPNSNYVWALKDINFEVQQGDALGIIGKNGAGKSTLLKLLSKVTAPTTGKIKIKGRIASLLEVGTGFHPELSGRENIFLNGAIMGMTKDEIRSKFDEIVEFSGVENYIDTPVKRYSSGMYVRLAFAVAAHLEPEILVVDEVLAVGDAEFQKKCLGKMSDVAKGGRTVLFVSHNMGAVKSLCNKGIVIENGKIKLLSTANNAVEYYMNDLTTIQQVYNFDVNTNNPFGYAISLSIENLSGKPLNPIPLFEKWQIRLKFQLNQDIPHFIAAIGFKNKDDQLIRTVWSKPVNLEKGIHEYIFIEHNVNFGTGIYILNIGLSSRETSIYFQDTCASIEFDNLIDKGKILRPGSGIILNQMDVINNKISS